MNHDSIPNGAGVAWSVLDLAPIPEGSDAGQAMRNSLDLARHAEQLGYHRYWLAEHHNMPGIASAATAVLIGYVANGTRTIRVGSGGVMLPNHSPLVIAEQFGTLPRTTRAASTWAWAARPAPTRPPRALAPPPVGRQRRYLPAGRGRTAGVFRRRAPRPAPARGAGAGLKVPIWLLGSSLFSAQLAAAMGLPFAFASHFAPGFMRQAVDLYRRTFRPSEALDRPYVMLGLNVFAAETGGEARRLFSSLQQQFLALVRGTPGQLRAPVDDIESLWTESEADHIRRSLACSVVGDPDTVRAGMQRFVDDLRPDELMLAGQIHDHQARLRSFAIAADAARSLKTSSAL